jgi:3-carboxy-cis,cis-muconate cycloisomerase
MPVHVIDSVFFKDLYGTAQMRAVWDDVSRLQKWLDYEAALARAEAEVGIVPQAAADEIARKARAELMDLDAIKRGVDKTVHPLISIIRQLSDLCDDDAGGYVHWGATTQDVMDTGLILQIRDAWPILTASLTTLITTLCTLARNYRDTPMVGRTHGQQALPITFGYKTAVWLAEILRHRSRLQEMRERVLMGEFGGAVGTLASVSEHGIEINERLMRHLGLNAPVIAWHTSRDHIAEFACVLTYVSATLGKIAHEVIELQKIEIGELEEPFEFGKVGSSTMPQKRNPMLCEVVLTLARLTRQHATVAVDAMYHEHERDWSSFQMEWEFLPELCVMTHGALEITNRVLAELRVFPETMRRNLDATSGLLLAERIMLSLGEHVGRQRAHDVVYEIAMHAVENRQSFAELLCADIRVSPYLSTAQIRQMLDPETYTGLAGAYVDRVLGQAAAQTAYA